MIFLTPSERAEHRSAIRGFREPPDRARGALFAPGELGERLIARGAQGTARCVGGEETGCPSLWFLSLGQARERNPGRRGRSHPQLSFEIAREARDNI